MEKPGCANAANANTLGRPGRVTGSLDDWASCELPSTTKASPCEAQDTGGQVRGVVVCGDTEANEPLGPSPQGASHGQPTPPNDLTAVIQQAGSELMASSSQASAELGSAFRWRRGRGGPRRRRLGARILYVDMSKLGVVNGGRTAGDGRGVVDGGVIGIWSWRLTSWRG